MSYPAPKAHEQLHVGLFVCNSSTLIWMHVNKPRPEEEKHGFFPADSMRLLYELKTPIWFRFFFLILKPFFFFFYFELILYC